MKNALTILRRDLAAYFTSPIGYIFMIVFILISVGLYITSFFTFPVADMRPYFTNLPLLLCVFIPAVTMRIWAEERKENTWEMLLTFPMKAWELVVGKFLASLVFFAFTLAGTFTIPVMLAALGNPDSGAVFGGYLGTFLLGAFFLALGIFFSGFFKDQIVAFVVTLLFCFAVFLLGTDFIASYIDGTVPGLGTLLSQLVGIADHYNAFTRGVIEAADLLYFVVWTVLFLVLNVMYIEGRMRPQARLLFAGAVVISVAIGLLFNWLLVGQSLARWDATEDKVYTMSEASKKILSEMDAPVQVKLYVTPREKMPTAMRQVEQNVKDKLEELRVASNDKVQYSTVYLEVANILASEKDMEKPDEEAKTEDEVIEKRMLDKGVEPFSVRAIGADEVTDKLVYSSIGIGYKDKKEEIIPQVMPENLNELEYRIVSTVFKLTRDKAPVIALVAPKESVTIDPQYRQLLEQMGQQIPTSDDPYVYLEKVLDLEKYEVKRVDVTQDSPLPDEYDVLAVINPRQLNERQRWEIGRALVSGKPVLLAVQKYEWDYRATRSGTSLSKRDENPQVNELLKGYGITVSDDILMDTNHVPLRIQGGGDALSALFGGGQVVNLPTHILVNNTSMDPETSITSRLSTVFYLWGSPLEVDEDTLKKHALDYRVLMSTTDRAWTRPASETLTSSSFEPPDSGLQKYPLMAMVTGQFPDLLKDTPRPEWPAERPMPGQPPRPPRPDDTKVKPITPAPGKLVVLGCSEMFRKNFLQAGNLDLFMNAIDALALSDDLVHVRSRKPIDRTIDMPSPAKRQVWKFANYTLASTLIAVAGIISSVARRRARNAYTASFGAAED